ncbi:MAG: phosphotransferase [Thermodesulfovibrionales bacterium]|nr:phosphotransferase [Thermodesulfovibrionales bacterium]
MIDETSLKNYAFEKFQSSQNIEILKLGSGVHGTGFMIKITLQDSSEKSYVIKELTPQALGHDYPSDRASVFLLAYDEYNKLPKHVKAVDVLSLDKDGQIKSISGGKEYFLLMETASGQDYFKDLEDMKDKPHLTEDDNIKIKSMSNYLASIHKVKTDNRHLYWRKIRDTIGHGECLMGVFDFYPDGTLTYEQMAQIEKMTIDWRAKLKTKYHRLCQIHGDFHPGNIWFQSKDDFILLDRSRGAYGDSADDISAITINYLFYSVMYHGEVKGAYKEAFNLFFDNYLSLTSDEEILSVLAPFYAFRGAVVCNPIFYPNMTKERREIIFDFVRKVLSKDTFDYKNVERLIE